MTEPLLAHSPIGASSCERWLNCPGSVNLAKGLPPSKSSIYAATGTVAHMLGEMALNNYIKFGPMHCGPYEELKDEVGRSYVESDFEIEVTEEMVEAVEVYLDAVVKYAEQYCATVQPEVRFHMPHIDPQAFGTCDAMLYATLDRIIVIDYKHGQGHAVEVENNYQLKYYALGAYYSLPEDLRDIGYVEMVIVQPRAKHLDGPVRSCVITKAELLAFEVELKEAIARVRAADASLQVGKWCTFCTARPVCPALRKNIEEKACLVFDKIEQEPLELPEVSTIQPERLAKLMENAALFRSWCDSVAALATALAEKGVEIPGYKMVDKYGDRRWINEKDVESAYSLELGDDLYNKKLKSPAQLEKILKKRKDELADYVEKPLTGRVLVPVSDGRHEVPTGPTSVFDTFIDVDGV